MFQLVTLWIFVKAQSGLTTVVGLRFTTPKLCPQIMLLKFYHLRWNRACSLSELFFNKDFSLLQYNVFEPIFQSIHNITMCVNFLNYMLQLHNNSYFIQWGNIFFNFFYLTLNSQSKREQRDTWGSSFSIYRDWYHEI